MPDPKECRRRALEYVWLSRAPASSQEREAYLNLAKIWLRLAKDLGVANDLENCQRVVEDPDELQYKKARSELPLVCRQLCPATLVDGVRYWHIAD